MNRILKCGDVIPGCDAEMRGDSDEEILRQAAEHARTAHGLKEVDAATAQKVKSAIRNG
jgi:predicted small metal-binding protein